MRMRLTSNMMVLLTVVLGLSGCGRHEGLSSLNPLAPNLQGISGLPAAPSSLVVPAFNPPDFVAHVDNPYFPLTPGTIYSYVGEGQETNEVEVTHETKTILGVATTVVHDQVFLDGSLIEDTFDWYAQDKEGNVWYLGEDTKEYENGNLVSTAGSWEAGKDGAKPGVIMLAHPRVGDSYRQEDAPGVVADMGRVLSRKETVTVPYGTFEGCLQTMEWTPLEPGNRSFKYYASGLGPVLEVSPRGGRERVELTAVTGP